MMDWKGAVKKYFKLSYHLTSGTAKVVMNLSWDGTFFCDGQDFSA